MCSSDLLVTGKAASLDPTALDPAMDDTPTVWCKAQQPYGAGDFGSPGAANPSCANADPAGSLRPLAARRVTRLDQSRLPILTPP